MSRPAPTRRLFMDTRPLRESPAFRRLWIGSGISAIGSQMTAFAVALQVFTITHSPVAVGALGLCVAVPSIIFGLFGGSIIDAANRRVLVLVTTTVLGAASAALAGQAFAGLHQVWLLYLLVSIAAAANALDQPARRTFLPDLLPTERLPAGAALTMLTFHGSWMVGPVLAGLVAGAWGLRACYLFDALSFAAALYGVFRLPVLPPHSSAARPGPRAVAEGLRFIAGRRVLVGAFLADMNATVFGMPVALFPAINAERFGGSPHTLGLITSAVAVGGVLGSALSGPLGRVRRHGRTILIGSSVWGVALAGFGLAHRLWLALALLTVAGAADVLSVISRSTIVQVVPPDRYRGRVNAADFVVGGAAPQLGNFRAGAVGSLTTPTISAVSGGLMVVAGAALIRLTIPALTRYTARSTHPPP
jgi:MFS family permease